MISFIELFSGLAYMLRHGEGESRSRPISGETVMTKTNTVTQVSTMIAGLILGLYGVLYVVHVAGLI
jgi:hypothetical protein